tara:strand:- start:499 stop:1230 length:732 start_codon:yes stop_codon:yes gene_type:complete
MHYIKSNKYFRRYFFSIIGFLNSFFIKFSNELPTENIIILGRGESLNVFIKNHKKFSNIKHLILVNFSKQDFENIDKNIFKNKIVHISVNINEDIIPFHCLYKFTFGKVFISRFKNYKSTNIKPDRKNYKANVYSNRLEYLPEKLKNYWWVNNSGILAIVYAVYELNIKNIYLFGFDFYQGNFHNSDLYGGFKTSELAIRHQIAGKKLIKNLKKIIGEFSQNNFYFPNLENFNHYNNINVKKI